jgi:hypothetical protein
MANRPVLLNLDTLVVRPLVTIDAKDYEMLNPGEVSILDLHRFGALGAEFEGIASSVKADTALTQEQVQAVSVALDRMVRMILRAPEEVLSRLTDVHRYNIIQAFNSLTPSKLPAPSVSKEVAGPVAPPMTDLPTSEKS